MTELMDFQILQRGDDGYAHVTFSGTYNGEITEKTVIQARVVREDDGLNVIYWTNCDIDGQNWSVKLDIPEGGLYRLEACIETTDYTWNDKIKILHYIGVGDVYVTAGQSNMTGYGRDVAFDPPTLGVHALANNGQWRIASHPLADAIGTLFEYPEYATGTSPALSFARRLRDRLGIPIGIIPTAVGCTALSAWHPEQGVGTYFERCYERMCKHIELIGGFKGFVWYQGCSDTGLETGGAYFDDFKRMVELWRAQFGHKPILTVQLNRIVGVHSDDAKKGWGLVVDAQRRAGLEIPDVYVVPSMDLTTLDGVHNNSASNIVIGERLANAALAGIYKKPGQTAVSIIGAEMIDETHVLLKMTPNHHIYTPGNVADGMNVEDSEGIVSCEHAKENEEGVVIRTSRPYSLPAKFHYAWNGTPPTFFIREAYDMPVLACYGIEIEDKK
ncbi:MAG: sialate O-acetylesterase [Ruminococcaceae bacterium]|nr:sialate O-acetylesterase [Oscillospiraceae bacterium]